MQADESSIFQCRCTQTRRNGIPCTENAAVNPKKRTCLPAGRMVGLSGWVVKRFRSKSENKASLVETTSSIARVTFSYTLRSRRVSRVVETRARVIEEMGEKSLTCRT
ncbi:hypothetical protein MRX96_021652 [Rhipicephalus microplus]